MIGAVRQYSLTVFSLYSSLQVSSVGEHRPRRNITVWTGGWRRYALVCSGTLALSPRSCAPGYSTCGGSDGLQITGKQGATRTAWCYDSLLAGCYSLRHRTPSSHRALCISRICDSQRLVYIQTPEAISCGPYCSIGCCIGCFLGCMYIVIISSKPPHFRRLLWC